jgi:hypothetical protein
MNLNKFVGKWYVLQHTVRYVYDVKEIDRNPWFYYIKVEGTVDKSYMDASTPAQDYIEIVDTWLGTPYDPWAKDFHIAVMACFDHKLARD